MTEISNQNISAHFLKVAKEVSRDGLNQSDLHAVARAALEDGKISAQEFEIMSRLHNSDFQKEFQTEGFDFEKSVTFPDATSDHAEVKMSNGSSMTKSELETIASISKKADIYTTSQKINTDGYALAHTTQRIMNILRENGNKSNPQLLQQLKALRDEVGPGVAQNIGFFDPSVYGSDEGINMMTKVLQGFHIRQSQNAGKYLSVQAHAVKSIKQDIVAPMPVIHTQNLSVNSESDTEISALKKQHQTLTAELDKLNKSGKRGSRTRKKKAALEEQLRDTMLQMNHHDMGKMLEDQSRMQKAQQEHRLETFTQQKRLDEETRLDISAVVKGEFKADDLISITGENSQEVKNARRLEQMMDSNVLNTFLTTFEDENQDIKALNTENLNINEGTNAIEALMVGKFSPESSEDLDRLNEIIEKAQRGDTLKGSDQQILMKFGIGVKDNALINIMTNTPLASDELRGLQNLITTLKEADSAQHVNLLTQISAQLRSQLSEINALIKQKSAELDRDSQKLKKDADETLVQIESVSGKIDEVDQKQEEVTDQLNLLNTTDPEEIRQNLREAPPSALNKSLKGLGINVVQGQNGELSFEYQGREISLNDAMQMLQSDLQTQIDQLQQEKTALQVERDQLNDKLSGLRQLQQEVLAQQRDLQGLIAQADQIEAQLGGITRSLKTYANDPNIPSDVRDKARAEAAENQRALRDSEKTHQQALSVLENSKSITDSTAQVIAQAEQTLQAADNALDSLQRMIDQLQEKYLMLDKIMKNSEAERQQTERVRELLEEAAELSRTLELAPRPESEDVHALTQDWLQILQGVERDFSALQAEAQNHQRIENTRLEKYAALMQELSEYQNEYLDALAGQKAEHMQGVLEKAIYRANIQLQTF